MGDIKLQLTIDRATALREGFPYHGLQWFSVPLADFTPEEREEMALAVERTRRESPIRLEHGDQDPVWLAPPEGSAAAYPPYPKLGTPGLEAAKRVLAVLRERRPLWEADAPLREAEAAKKAAEFREARLRNLLGWHAKWLPAQYGTRAAELWGRAVDPKEQVFMRMGVALEEEADPAAVRAAAAAALEDPRLRHTFVGRTFAPGQFKAPAANGCALMVFSLEEEAAEAALKPMRAMGLYVSKVKAL